MSEAKQKSTALPCPNLDSVSGLLGLHAGQFKTPFSLCYRVLMQRSAAHAHLLGGRRGASLLSLSRTLSRFALLWCGTCICLLALLLLHEPRQVDANVPDVGVLRFRQELAQVRRVPVQLLRSAKGAKQLVGRVSFDHPLLLPMAGKGGELGLVI